jgi:hypothetical protein
MIPLSTMLSVLARSAILFLLGRKDSPRGHGLSLNVALAAILVYGGFQLGALLVNDYAHPREWDFPAFYLDGSVAAAGKDIHAPSSYREVAPTLEIPAALGDEFVREIHDTGFRYPSPSMFLFVPLGLFGFQTAHALWMVFLAVGLGLAIVCTWRWLDGEHRSWRSLLLVALLVVYLGPTWQTAEFEQTNFVSLALIALFLGSSNDRTRGIVAGLAPFVKPLLGFLAVGLILERRWISVRTALVTVAAAYACAALAFGFGPLASYFLDSPLSRMPPWVYNQEVNQSLLAEILRRTVESDPSRIGPGNPIFVTMALALALPTLLMAAYLLARGRQAGYGLLLSLALLLYPQTLMHYSILAVVPALFLVKECSNTAALLLASAAGGVLLTLLDVSVFLGDLGLWEASILLSLATVLAEQPRHAALPQWEP